MSNNLNNKVVIPAKNSIDFPTVSLAKNNKISSFAFSNDNYLARENISESYLFSTTSNFSGENASIWEEILSNETVSFTDSVPTTKTGTLLSYDDTQGKSVRVNGQIRFYANSGNAFPQEKTFRLTNHVFNNGYRRVYSEIWENSMLVGGRWDFVISYSGGFFTFQATYTQSVGYLEKWSIDLDITKIEYMPEQSESNTISANGAHYSIKSNVSCTLSDDGKILTIPLTDTSTSISSLVSYTKKTSASEEGETVEKENVVVFNRTFGSPSEFKNHCASNANGTTSVYIGFPNSVKKTLPNGNFFRFDQTFKVYACIISLGKNGETYEDFTVDFYSTSGQLYKSEKQNIGSLGETNEASTFNYQGNSLFQEDTVVYVNGQPSSIIDHIQSDVVNKFGKGRNTVKMSIFYDKYLDFNGQVVYDETNGYFPKVDDIVVPHTIRTTIASETPIEVPVLSNGYAREANGRNQAIGKQFYVTSCNLEYDGDFAINLELIEKTSGVSSDNGDEAKQYTLYVPRLPTSGVESVVINRTKSPSGQPLGLIATAEPYADRYLIYEGDELEIVGQALSCYNDPAVSLTSYVANGDVYATMTAGSIKTYTVSFDLNGGLADDIPPPFVINCGTTLNLSDYQTPTRVEDSEFTYRFDHWETPSGEDMFEVHEDVVIIARYYRTAKPKWYKLQLTNTSWDMTPTETGPSYSTVSFYMSKTNSSIRNAPTKFYTGTDGNMIMQGNEFSYNTVKYTFNEKGNVLGGGSNRYAASGKNYYGNGFGYSLEATSGKITFTAWADVFADGDAYYGNEPSQKYYPTSAHITLKSIDQLYADSSKNGIV